MPATYPDFPRLTISISNEELIEEGVIGYRALNTAVRPPRPVNQLASSNGVLF